MIVRPLRRSATMARRLFLRPVAWSPSLGAWPPRCSTTLEVSALCRSVGRPAARRVQCPPALGVARLCSRCLVPAIGLFQQLAGDRKIFCLISYFSDRPVLAIDHSALDSCALVPRFLHGPIHLLLRQLLIHSHTHIPSITQSFITHPLIRSFLILIS